MPPHAPKRHIRLDSGNIIATDRHYGVWLPTSFCTGMALHKPGQPGAVVGHRAYLSRGCFRESPTGATLGRLNAGEVVNLEEKYSHPSDFIALMRSGAERFGDPAKMTLTIMPGNMPDMDVVRHIAESAREAKNAGHIADFSILRATNGKMHRVQATDGTIHLEDIRALLGRFGKKPNESEWIE